MWFVFEAEYAIENGRANWNKPLPETMAWHGPFATAEEADKVVRGRMSCIAGSPPRARRDSPGKRRDRIS